MKELFAFGLYHFPTTLLIFLWLQCFCATVAFVYMTRLMILEMFSE